MNFDAESNTITGLLYNPRNYQIPRFQRDFSWDKSNYNEFLNDMLGQIKFENNKFNNTQYYLGNMLFLGDKSSKSVEVIDGQQRLTTITILLASLRNSLFKLGNQQAKDYAETIQDYLVKKIDGTPQRKVQTFSSYPYFTQTIQDYHTANNEVEPKTKEEELLRETFHFFNKNLQKTELVNRFNKINKASISEDSYLDLLISLRDQILNSEIVSIFSADKQHVNRIFQNINSKGKPLSQLDLIKNDLFSKIDITSAGVDEMSKDWGNMLEKLSEIDVSINEFFFHFWKATYPKDTVTSTNLYRKYINKYDKSNQDELLRFIKLLANSLDIYSDIVSPDPRKYTRQEKKAKEEFHKSLSNFHGVQARILLLALYCSLKEKHIKLKNKSLINFLGFISDFHFIVFGTSVKIRTNMLSRPYKKFVKDIHSSTNEQDIKNAMSTLKSDLLKILNKDDVINSFKELSYSKGEKADKSMNYSSQYAIKRIANILDNRSYSSNEYSIEHIIDESEGNSLNIGNLVVLETRLNEKINSLKQNSGTITYNDKIKIYDKSGYQMIKSLLHQYPSFTRDNFNKRAEELALSFWDNFSANKGF